MGLVTGRTALALLLLLLLVAIHACDAAFDFKSLIKRRPRSARNLNDDDDDVEASAEKARTYHTACDQELARSLVILGEQKEQSEAALDACKSQRAKALENSEFLTKKVEVVTMSLDESEKRCKAMLHEERIQLDIHLADLQDKLENINAEHEEATTSLMESHNATLEEILSKHKEEMKSLKETNKASLSELQKEKEGVLSTMKKERESAKAKEEQILAAHKSELKKKENEIATCQKSLGEATKANEKLESNYQRSLQKIAVLENVTAYTLAVEEARDFGDYMSKLASVIWDPIYDNHLKEPMEKAKKLLEQAQVKLEPVSRSLTPVTQPIRKEYEQIQKSTRAKCQELFDGASNYLVGSKLCTGRTDLKAWEKQHKLDAHLSRASDEVCNNPDDYLAAFGWCALILLAFILRRFILRAFLTVLFLPVRILIIVPFNLLFKSSPPKEVKSKKSPP